MQHPPPRVGEPEPLAGPGDADVGEPALLLEVALLDRPRVREDALLAADHEHRLVLEPLRVVEAHQRRQALLLLDVVLLGDQPDLGEELLQRGRVLVALEGAVGVELAGDADQLLEVLDPALGLDRALRLERLDVAADPQHGFEDLRHRLGPLDLLPQHRHRVREPVDRLERGGCRGRGRSPAS